MNMISILLFEFTHFRRNKSKVFSYLLFLLACLYAIYNGFELQKKQQDTIQAIKQEQQEEIGKVKAWFEEGKKGPEDRAWVDIHEPYWSLRYTPTFEIKQSSVLLPLGIGQAEHYGYYKEVTFWSTTYDKDMVEEIANPERLVNGNIDFSFLVIYLLPLLLIILTYNVGGLEKDAGFDKLITIQFGSLSKWLGVRFAFYVALLLSTVVLLILGVAFLNNGLSLLPSELGALIFLSTGYILSFAAIFFLVLLYGASSSSIAFNMIATWLLLCLLVPGAVHQYASMKVPVNYMTDYLDVNRKETYATYSLPSDSLSKRLLSIYPKVAETKHGQEAKPKDKIVRRSVGAIINEMNKAAVVKIEEKNESKNQLIRSSYWFNPIPFVQNQWNSYTSSDYYSYQRYRVEVQKTIVKKMELLVFDTWNKKRIEQEAYEQYIQELK